MLLSTCSLERRREKYREVELFPSTSLPIFLTSLYTSFYCSREKQREVEKQRETELLLSTSLYLSLLLSTYPCFSVERNREEQRGVQLLLSTSAFSSLLLFTSLQREAWRSRERSREVERRTYVCFSLLLFRQKQREVGRSREKQRYFFLPLSTSPHFSLERSREKQKEVDLLLSTSPFFSLERSREMQREVWRSREKQRSSSASLDFSLLLPPSLYREVERGRGSSSTSLLFFTSPNFSLEGGRAKQGEVARRGKKQLCFSLLLSKEKQREVLLLFASSLNFSSLPP